MDSKIKAAINDLTKRELKSAATKMISKRLLFPKSYQNIKFNATLSEYQTKKIKKAIFEIARQAGGLHIAIRDIVPMRNAKKYMGLHDMPIYQRGIFLPGGARDNHNVSYSAKAGITYERGELRTKRGIIPLDCRTEETIKNDLRNKRHALKKSNLSKLYLTANGRFMHPGGHLLRASYDVLQDQALEIFLKYEELAAAGEFRSNGRSAAHPSKWGIGIGYAYK